MVIKTKKILNEEACAKEECVRAKSAEVLFFKSFVESANGHATTTYDPVQGSRTICQTLQEVLQSEVLEPNTLHTQLQKRLCASYIHPGYQGTYRPCGLVFETKDQPDYAVPFDMMALTDSEQFTSAGYAHALLAGSSRFIYSGIDSMIQEFPCSQDAIAELNVFRKKNNLARIDPCVMQYNECCFERAIAMRPVALIGDDEAYRSLADKYHLALFASMQEYLTVEEQHRK